jgi:hypothetical protein
MTRNLKSRSPFSLIGRNAIHRASLSQLVARAGLSAGWFLLATAAVGCATAAVTPKTAAAPEKLSRPQLVYVRNFAVVADDIKESHGFVSETQREFSSTSDQQRELEIGHAAAKALSDRLAKDLRALGFEVEEQTGGLPASGDFLLVEGQFMKVDEGAAVRRVVVGFGVGKSTMDTQVHVYRISDGTRQEVLTFETHADSGRLPGSALLMGASAAATGGVTLAGGAAAGGIAGGKAYLGRVNYLSDLTADQVNAYLSRYFAQQDWISADQARKVKIAPAQSADSR